eukprot:scaffold114813_cov35-Prasinocladus_malaysianus.AAC.1
MAIESSIVSLRGYCNNRIGGMDTGCGRDGLPVCLRGHILRPAEVPGSPDPQGEVQLRQGHQGARAVRRGKGHHPGPGGSASV